MGIPEALVWVAVIIVLGLLLLTIAIVVVAMIVAGIGFGISEAKRSWRIRKTQKALEIQP